MKHLYLFLFFATLCYGQKKEKKGDKKAELYYEEAYKILNNTTHNALSEELALKALDYSNKALERNPKVSKYHRVKGTCYIQLKKYDIAIENLNVAVQIDSTNALAWMGLGIAYENTERFELAEKNYRKSYELDNNATLMVNFGLLYDKWGKLDLSIKAYDIAIQLNPKSTNAYINRGSVKLRKGLYYGAIADFNKGIALDDQDKLSYNNRGLCKYYTKDYQGAIADFEKALQINLGKSFDENFDTDKYSYNNMANSYFELGNTEKACEFWNIAIQKGYQYQKKWKAIYNIDDPKELIQRHCH